MKKILISPSKYVQSKGALKELMHLRLTYSKAWQSQ